MKKIVYIALFLSVFFIACSSDNTSNSDVENNNIELVFSVNSYIKNATKATTNQGTTEEQTIDNLYVFLFPTTSSQTLIKYYTSTSAFTGGLWNGNDKKISLDLTQVEVGIRNVYIVANCSSIKTDLDAVASPSELQSVLQTSSNPWSPNMSSPILMSGNKTHNFNSNYQLSSVPLVRAIAKVQLNIKLATEHQALPIVASRAQYNYKYIDFDKSTYVLKPSVKTDNLVSSTAWTAWEAAGTVTSYVLDQGKVTSLTLITYLNERDNAGSAIEISLPYQATGPLPPPEFGDETYKLLLPAKIERNNWYVYDIEI